MFFLKYLRLIVFLFPIFLYGQSVTVNNPTNVSIPDNSSGVRSISISGAPSNAVITKVDWIIKLTHGRHADLSARLSTSSSGLGTNSEVLWTEGSLSGSSSLTRTGTANTEFDDLPVNRTMYFVVWDNEAGFSGFISDVTLTIHYSVPTPSPSVSSISPTTATLGQSKTFTINGSNLTNSMAWFIENFGSGTVNSSSSTTRKIFSSTGNFRSGNKEYEIKTESGGNVLKSGTISLSYSTPSRPSATAQGTNKIQVSWSAVNAIGNFLYRLYRGTSTSFSAAKQIHCAINSTTHTDEGNHLSPNTTYYYWIQTCNDNESCFATASSLCSNESSSRSVTTQAPSNPTVNSINPTSAIIGQAKVFTIEGSNLTNSTAWFIDNFGSGTVNSSNSTTSKTFSTTGNYSSGDKLYQIKSISGGTILKSGTIQLSYPTPNRPIATSQGANKIKIDWNQVDATGGFLYRLYRGASNNFSAARQIHCAINSTTYTDEGNHLSPNTTYYYWIQTCNDTESCFATASSLCSNESSSRSVTTQASSNPTVTSINPTSAIIGQAKTFTIEGANLTNSTAWFIDEFGSGTVNSSNSTTSKTFSTTGNYSSGDKLYQIKSTSGGTILKSGTVQLSYPTPNRPIAISQGTNKVKIDWNQVDATGDFLYRLYRGASNNFSAARQIDCRQNVGTYTDEGNHLNPNTTYYYWIQYCNYDEPCEEDASSLCSNESLVISVTTDAANASDGDDIPQNANTLTLNSFSNGIIADQIDHDWHKVTVPVAGALTISIDVFNDFDINFRLFDDSILDESNPNGSTTSLQPTRYTNPDGNPGNDNGYGENEFYENLDVEAGIYYIKVALQRTPITNKNYRIYADFVPTPTLSLPINASLDISLTPNLAWNESVADQYRLQIADEITFNTPHFNENIGEVTLYNLSNPNELSENTQYYWRVKAAKLLPIDNAKVVSSAYSTTWNFTTESNSTGNIPPEYISSSVSPEAASSGVNRIFTCTWHDEIGQSIIDVRLRYRKTETSNWTTVNGNLTYKSGSNGNATFSKTVAVTGSEGTYEYEFQADDSKGEESDWEGEEEFIIEVPLAIPNIPSGLIATSQGTNKIYLNWEDVQDAEAYKLFRSTTINGYYQQIYWAEESSKIDFGNHLKPNTTYYYKVKAVNNVGESDYSNYVAATTDDNPALPPFKISINKKDFEVGEQLTVNWENVPSNISNLKISLKRASYTSSIQGRDYIVIKETVNAGINDYTFTIPASITTDVSDWRLWVRDAAAANTDVIDNIGDITISTSVSTTLDCDNAITLVCGEVYNGNTQLGQNNIEAYGCNNAEATGKEIVHKIEIDYDGVLQVIMQDLNGKDLKIFILSECNLNSCLASGNQVATLINATSGTYYIIVDGLDREEGTYNLTVNCPEAPVQNYKITGTVRDAFGNPLQGAEISYQRFNDITNELGEYEIITPTDIGGGYLKAMHPSYNFREIVIGNLYEDLINQDFFGTSLNQEVYSIEGRITFSDGSALKDEVIKINGELSVRTDSEGKYIIKNINQGEDIYLTPQLSGFYFQPSGRTFIDINENIEDANFVFNSLANIINRPIRGDNFLVGSVQEVSWNSLDIHPDNDSVRISYITRNGEIFMPQGIDYPNDLEDRLNTYSKGNGYVETTNDGIFEWVIPFGIVRNEVIIRIIFLENGVPISYESSSFNFVKPKTGVTVLVHGFSFFGRGLFNEPVSWTESVAKAIIERVGSGSIFHHNNGSGKWIPLEGFNNSNNPNDEIVLIYNWRGESDNFANGWAEAAGHNLFASLLVPPENLNVPTIDRTNTFLLEKKLHFIAHSRGAIVSLHAFNRINEHFKFNDNIRFIDHFTTLDPHPAYALGIINDSASDFIVSSKEDQMPYKIQIPDNVLYADNYFRRDGIYESILNEPLEIINTEFSGSFDGIKFLIENDEFNNIELCENTLNQGGYGGIFSGGEHADVPLWYLGTIKYVNANIKDVKAPYEWYYSNGTGYSTCENNIQIPSRFNKGYNFSRDEKGQISNLIRVKNQFPTKSTNGLYLFNGHFSYAGPGWEKQGGGGDGSIEKFENLLRLDDEEERWSNFFYLPNKLDNGEDITHICLDAELDIPSMICPSFSSEKGFLIIWWIKFNGDYEELGKYKFALSLFKKDPTHRVVIPDELKGTVGRLGFSFIRTNDNDCMYSTEDYLLKIDNVKFESLENYVLYDKNSYLAQVTGSLLPGALISKYSTENTSEFLNYTDELGFTNLNFNQRIGSGDTLKIEAPGKETITTKVTQEQLNANDFNFPMIKSEKATQLIDCPSVSFTNPKTIFTENKVDLIITSLNHVNGFEVNNLSDTLTAPVKFTSNIESVNIGLLKGFNYVEVRYFGAIDTISLRKEVIYYPEEELPFLTYDLKLTIDESAVGGLLYIDGSFIKTLESKETIPLLFGNHTINVQKFGYKGFSGIVSDINNHLDISLEEKIFLTSNNSSLLDFSKDSIQYWRGITIQKVDNPQSGHLFIKRYLNDYNEMDLISKSETFEIQNLDAPEDEFNFKAILNQKEAISDQEIYILQIDNNTSFSKYLKEDWGENLDYDSLNQTLKFRTIKTKEKTELVLMQRQGVLPIENQSFSLNIEQTSIKIPLNQLVQDPDKIDKDIRLISLSTINGMEVKMENDTFYIENKTASLGDYTINFRVSHDGIITEHSFTLRIETIAKPIADFISDKTIIDVGETIRFSDNSSNLPSSWSWTFNGGTPATSDEENPSIQYNNVGLFEVRLKVSNSEGEDEVVKSGFIKVEDLAGNIVSQKISLEKGWNLISFFIDVEKLPIEDVFNSVSPYLIEVQNQNQLKYIPDNNSNSLTNLINGKGYWINVNEVCELNVQGQEILRNNAPIPLVSQWNLLGFYGSESINIETALGATLSDIAQIKDTKDSFVPNLPPHLNTLKKLEPGKGYWVKMKRATNLIYNY